MRILVFSSTFAPLTGGVETVTRRLASELHRQGHEVVVLTNRYPWRLAPREQMDLVPVIRRRYPNLLPSPGRRSPLTLLKYLVSLPLAAMELIYLVGLLRRLRPDIANLHYFSYPTAYGLLAARLLRIPTVISFHGSDAPGTPHSASYRWTARAACALADEIVCCSQALASVLSAAVALPPGRVSVIHSGVDVPVPDQGATAASRPHLLVVGRLVETKGIDVAIRAARELKRLGVEFGMQVVGDGPDRATLEGLVTTLGLVEDVTLLGQLEGARVGSLILEARIVIVPSRWDAFGMACLEAMASSKAVVASRVGGIPEIVVDGETGLLVSPDQPEALAEAIAALLKDPIRAQAMGARGRERVQEHFTWAGTIARYEAVLRSAVSTHAHAD